MGQIHQGRRRWASMSEEERLTGSDLAEFFCLKGTILFVGGLKGKLFLGGAFFWGGLFLGDLLFLGGPFFWGTFFWGGPFVFGGLFFLGGGGGGEGVPALELGRQHSNRFRIQEHRTRVNAEYRKLVIYFCLFEREAKRATAPKHGSPQVKKWRSREDLDKT